ncbi:mandelate racemase/muconate lactonizing enzyme family protein [Quadrisphaera sp. INWT6]|uniref:mandelate racemase/muconate lactonizing enzyme family protein n=1 Tax=Quadrisphaera sp. INWT6 TaxID=2596917 RepID=UPI001891FFD1|nr:mandelate racemase/muconate lactonizing enzyme family protein [Quadrisphaera sp. INWT6]MBF5082312.1 mandelate racemase/muconate lactonizing enzyme family protein [Quadrisphaera sp. INWT6]
MKITGYRSLTTRHEWGRPVGDVNGVSDGTSTRQDVLVITTSDGVEGVALGAHADIDRVFPVLEGEDPRSVTGLYDRMLDVVFKLGHQGTTFNTLGTVDSALWDLKAKLAGEPLWRLLGARDRFVPGYASGLEAGLGDDDVAALYARFAERGFGAAKLKGGRHLDADLRRLGILRDAMSANTSHPGLMLDANESWHVSQAVRHVRALEAEFDLTWVEEPVRRWDVRGMASLRQQVAAGVASGENLTGLEQVRALVDGGAVDVVQPNAAWGITNLLRVGALAHAFDLPVSPIGLTFAVAAGAAALPNLLSIEVQDLSWPVGVDVDQVVDDGGARLGDSPGNGIVLDEAAFEEVPASAGWAVRSGPHLRPARAGLRLVPEDDAPEDRAPDLAPDRAPGGASGGAPGPTGGDGLGRTGR